MKAVRLMLIDAADATPGYLPLDLLPDGENILVEHAASAQAIELRSATQTTNIDESVDRLESAGWAITE